MKRGAWVLPVLLAVRASADTPDVSMALSPYLRTLQRPIDIYHCAPLARIGASPDATGPADASLTAYLKAKVARFWDSTLPPVPNGTASGLYAGIDPVVCRHFGGAGTGWALIRIRAPAGLAFLDLRAEGQPAPTRFPNAVAARLRKAGCDAGAPSELLLGTDSEACRRIAIATLARLAPAAMLADLPAFRFPQCARSGNGVFVILDPDRVPLRSSVLFTARIPGDDPSSGERAMIQEMYMRARRAGSHRDLPWPDARFDVAASAVDSWMERRLWGCGPAPAVSAKR